MGRAWLGVGRRGNLSGLGVGGEDLTGLGDRSRFVGGLCMGEVSLCVGCHGNLSGLVWARKT